MEINTNIDSEIEELEKQIFGTQEAEDVEETTADLLESTQEEVEVVEAVSTPEVTTQKQEHDYEKRFKNYKAKTDLVIRDLRSELATSKAKYANLQSEYSDLYQKFSATKSSNSFSIFSEDEVDLLGTDTANTINKGVSSIIDSRVKPLEEELIKSRKALAEKESEESKKIARDSYRKFLDRLGNVVPDYASINVDSKFIEYMNEVDEDSGYPNHELFKRAEEALDVKRVASFFKEFIERNNTKKDILERNITPSGVSQPIQKQTTGGKEVIISRKFIDKFYEDYARGKYKGASGRKEAARIEALIDQAVFTGNVK